jgi:NADPH-ferrihemoprotein reductase
MENVYLVAFAALVVVLISLALLALRRKRGDQSSGAVTSQEASTLKTIRSREKSLQDLANIDPSKPQIRILYGTQTGTAERFAKQLGKELSKKYLSEGTHVEILDIENYSGPDRLPTEKNRLVVFCMATYGDGEPTDNAYEFYSWLCKEAEAVEGGSKEPTLKGVYYAVFGLGNKQYEHFNAVGRRVFKCLGVLGACPLIPRGDGDDDGLIDEEFEKWAQDLMQALESKGPGSVGLVGPAGSGGGQEALTPAQVPAYEIDLAPASGKGSIKGGPAYAPDGTGMDLLHPFMAKASCVRELHGPASDRSCVHVELDITGCKVGPLLSSPLLHHCL